jgi:hypothetical protein
MIPKTYEEWKRCIEEDCGINLTKEFASKRLAVLNDKTHKETQNFLGLYGESHLQNLINWFKKHEK